MNGSDPPDFFETEDTDSYLPTAQPSFAPLTSGDFIVSSRPSIRATASSAVTVFSSQALLQDEQAGKIKLRLRTEFSYTWSNLRVDLHRKSPFWRRSAAGKSGIKTILDNVSGCAHSGELWALMGASGAGKTTLLNALNFRPTGRHATVSGDRRLNGSALTSEVISTISAYVEQDDLMIPRMTVLEHLYFNAKLRFPSSISWETRKKRVEEVLNELGLWHVRNSYIGGAGTVQGISGGEMKRLAFASEILTDPNILFCDEPTSGLDSFMATTVVDVMRKMAARGKLVICTIHQPSSEIFALFDNLYLLVGGRVAYSGAREDAPMYFAGLGYQCPVTHNPADFLIRLLSLNPDRLTDCEERVGELVEAFETSQLYSYILEESSKKRAEKDPEMHILKEQSKTKYRASFCAQICAVSWRTWTIFTRDPILLVFRVFQMIGCSILAGGVICNLGEKTTVQGAITLSGVFYCYTVAVFMVPAYIGVSIVSPTMELVKRENWKGLYHSSAYFLGLMTMDIPFFTVYPWLGFPIVWWLTSMQGPVQRMIRESLLLSIVSQTGVAMGYLASCVSNGVKMSLIVITALFIPSVMFCSALADVEGMFWAMRWIVYTCILNYTAEDLMIEQWTDVTDIYFTEPFVPELFGDGPGVLKYFGVNTERYLFNVVASITIAILFRLIAYIGVRVKCARL